MWKSNDLHLCKLILFQELYNLNIQPCDQIILVNNEPPISYGYLFAQKLNDPSRMQTFTLQFQSDITVLQTLTYRNQMTFCKFMSHTSYEGIIFYIAISRTIKTKHFSNFILDILALLYKCLLYYKELLYKCISYYKELLYKLIN